MRTKHGRTRRGKHWHDKEIGQISVLLYNLVRRRVAAEGKDPRLVDRVVVRNAGASVEYPVGSGLWQRL